MLASAIFDAHIGKASLSAGVLSANVLQGVPTATVGSFRPLDLFKKVQRDLHHQEFANAKVQLPLSGMCMPQNEGKKIAPPGRSEERLRDAFGAAQSDAAGGKRTILFFDEVDALCPRRVPGQEHETRVVAQMLTLLDGAIQHSGMPLSVKKI